MKCTSAFSRVSVLAIIFIGIIFIILNIAKNTREPPVTEIQYVHVPVTTDGEQAFNAYPSDIFESMFSQPSPWVISNENFDRLKQAQVNRFFISQH